MTLLKTPTETLDADWTYCGEITKTQVLGDGSRQIIGVASGIEEDLDGERMSKRCIAKMVAEGSALARNDNLPLTDTHTPDWSNKFGKVRALERDPDTHQLVLDTRLPPEGRDPLADKAWYEMHVLGKKLGFSVGGKLRKAFHEIDDQTGKRRRVLDDVAINHVMLTEKPAYDRSFALAVAKSFTGAPPAEDAFTETVDLEAERADAAAIVAKAKTPPVKPDNEDEPEPTPPAPDASQPAPPATPEDFPAAAGGDDDKPDAEPSDAELAADLPMARHLSCPNCGHEFAAELPDDLQPDDTAADTDADTGDQPTTKKTHTEHAHMSDTDLLAQIRKLVESSDVTKAEKTPEPPAPAEGDVMKTIQTLAQGLVSTHEQTTTELDNLRTETKETFEGVAKALESLTAAITAQPRGRRSIARILPPHGEDPAVTKSADEPEDLNEAIGKAQTPQAAFGEINKSMFPRAYAA